MRFYTLAWFYNAQDTLLHIRSLQFDVNTPHRAPNHLFGGTAINSFEYDLHLHQEKRKEDLSYTSPHGTPITLFREYMHEVVNGSVFINMHNNLHTTELWGYLTRGEPLSKIVVRIYEIQESGQFEPFVEYAFKECHLFEHKTQLDEYQIRFTYCCANMHFYDGNRFASHKRCTPFEPKEMDSQIARAEERFGQDNLARQQKVMEEERLKPLSVTHNQNTPTLHRIEVTAPAQFNGKQIPSDGLDDFSFHIVETPQSVDDLVKFLFNTPNETTRTNFLNMNPHINGGIVYPAQLVLVSDPAKSDYLTHELGLVRQLQQIDEQRVKIEGSHSDFAKQFTDLATFANFSMGAGFVTSYFKTHTKEVLKVLNEIENGFTSKYRMPGGTLRTNDFVDYRFKKYNELDSLLNKSMKTSLYGGIVGPKNAYNINAVRYAVEFDWNVQKSKVIPTLHDFYANVVNFNKALKVAGKLVVGLGAYDTDRKIKEACAMDQESCTHNKYVAWAGFWGETIGSFVVGESVAVTIAAVLASPAIGVGGLLAVGIIAIPSIGLGYYGGKTAGELFKVAGEILYQKSQPTPAVQHDNRSIEIELVSE